MKIDGALQTPQLQDVPQEAKRLQDLGYDGCFSYEGPREPFMPLLLAAEHAPQLQIATGLAIAFARTPMVVANIANDLHQYSGGRLLLGLGSQVRPHIEARYGMPWSKPVSRMKEFVRALHAIFRCWNEGERLDFRGEFYTHTLMTPMFNPGPNPHGRPPILLGGVGKAMVQAAGEVADGLLLHPLNTARYVETVTLPAVQEGLALSGRSLDDFVFAVQALVATGDTDEELHRSREAVRAQIAFYGSTPAYRYVLEAEGWGDLQPALRLLTKENRWGELGGLITDEVLERVAIVGTPKQVAAGLHARFAGFAQRLAFSSPYPLSAECAGSIVSNLKQHIAT